MEKLFTLYGRKAFVILCFVFSVATYKQTTAQVSCAMSAKDTTACRPFLLVSNALNTNDPSVTFRKWTLETCAGAQVTAPIINQPTFGFIINTPGCYRLRLESKNSSGDSCSFTQSNIIVLDTPVVNVNFAPSPTEGCKPFLVGLNCNIISTNGIISQVIVQPDCGPPIIGASCPSTINFPASCPNGCFDVSIIATDNGGCVGRKRYNDQVCLIPTPTACFTADTTTANCSTSPLPVTFTACNVIQSNLIKYKWLVNGTVVQDDTSKILNYVFPLEPDCYDVKLVVYHPSGCADSVSFNDYICNRPTPQTSFSALPAQVCVSAAKPGCVTLTDNTPGASNATITWNWTPGGAQQSGANASYCITTPGVYTVSETVTFAPGCSSTTSTQITALDRPTASFTIADTFACSVPFSTQLTAQTCAGCSYQWTTSGASVISPNNIATPTFTANNYSNSFNISLIVTSSSGCTDTLRRNGAIRVRRVAPRIGFNASKGCPPVCPTFTNLTNMSLLPGETISSVCWIFPDSGFATQCTTTPYTKCFNNVGCNDVWLAVSTLNGCVDTAKLVDTICVGAPPVCTATANPLTMCYEEDTVAFCVSCLDTFTQLYADFGDGTIQTYVNSSNQRCVDYFYQDIGTFEAVLITYSDSCVGDTFRFTITINPPAAKFAQDVACGSGDTIQLINQTVQANRFGWKFLCTGDSLTTVNPKIVLPQCDSCQVRLTAYNDTFNCVHTVDTTIFSPCGSAVITPLDTSVCRGRPVRFLNQSQTNGGTTSWRVLREDCTTPFANTVTNSTGFYQYTFNTPGNYCVRMITTLANGCVDTAYSTVNVCRPVANYSANDVCLPSPTCFTNLSTDTSCSITKQIWTFGNSLSTDTSFNPCYTFPAQGIYPVKLYVETTNGCRDSITQNVNVGAPLTLNYSLDTLLCPGQSSCVQNSTQGVALSWLWEAPDATVPVQTTATPCFTFPQAGDYLVYLTLVSAGSCSVYDTITIHYRNPVARGFVDIDTLTCPNPPVVISYTDSSLFMDANGTWTWSFGDGDLSTLKNPTHIYSSPGTYNVSLTVNNNGCSSATFVDTIVVLGPYGSMDFYPRPTICTGDSVTFDICTVKSTNLALLSGCSLYTLTTNINPVGTDQNPTCVSFTLPYNTVDSCLPQVVFGDGVGCQVYLDSGYLYIDTPDVKFRFDNYGVCVNGTVCFFDSTEYHLPAQYSYTIQRYWDFGDGSPIDSSNSPNPCHYYGQVGGYNVKLYIYSNHGCIDSSIGTVVVVPEFPIAGFYAEDSLTCQFEPICFYDTSYIYPLTGPDYWVWYWGDGQIDTVFGVPSACHAYDTGGYYRVTMCVYDSVGCPDCDSSVVIRVIDNPLAQPGADRIFCCNVVTQLNAAGGNSYQWLPTGILSNDTIPNPTFQLCNDTVLTLIVGNNFGCSDTESIQLTSAQVFADFNVGTNFCLDDSVCVTDASTNVNGVINSWTYDFGDNSVETGPNPCHFYTVPSSLYTITQTVVDTNGCQDTATRVITILPAPDALFSLNDSVICANEQICATDLSTSTIPITSWQWSWGDNSTPPTGTGPHCHTYTAPYQPGYRVSLRVTDSNSCFDTASIYVVVNELPVANFSWSTSCETEAMPLNSTSVQGDGIIVMCEWTLWQGAVNPTLDSNCNTSYQFPPGSYPVQLVIEDLNGCRDTIVKTVQSDSLSQLVISPQDTTICIGNSVSYTVAGVFDQIVWTPNVWIDDPNSSQVLITPLSTIGYIVNATNGVCDAASDSFLIQVIQQQPLEVDAVPDQIVLGLNSNLSSQIPGQIDSIIWVPDNTLDCRDCPNPIATPTQTTTYFATIYYSRNGVTCTTQDSVTITVLGSCDESVLYVPNTFTPNGDGLNDVFMIRGIAAVKINYFRIFDRWGKLVFETTNGEPNEMKWGWDGRDMNGEQLSTAVFVYTYEIECVNKDIVSGQGNVTLIR